MKTKELTKEYQVCLELLKLRFGKARELWETEARGEDGKWKDDRGVFCNMFDILVRSFVEMSRIKEPFIHVAFSERLKVKMDEMQVILDRFKR
jgi:hypothetical protein